ncbi:hypothetical protein ACSDQ9_05730 [Aestuariimicrobium soli]|uniref:hypothetical protein n=1 Tax=Aestuariimicrobium soli TaxID=2035834 RepID=UPI003EC00B1E
MSPALLGFLGIVIGGAITGGFAYLTQRMAARSNRDAQRDSTQLEWVRLMAEQIEALQTGRRTDQTRIETLERDVALQRRQSGSLAALVNRLGWWLAGGMRGPTPMPSPDLHDLIDPAPWQSLPPTFLAPGGDD